MTTRGCANRHAAPGERVWLRNQLDKVVGDLSHGQQRQLEIGVALVTDPDLIMLDEPASGLSRGERERLIELLDTLPRSTTLLLIEHDMDVALKVADRVVVMADGTVVASGSPDEIRQNSLVHAIYLGQAAAPDAPTNCSGSRGSAPDMAPPRCSNTSASRWAKNRSRSSVATAWARPPSATR